MDPRVGYVALEGESEDGRHSPQDGDSLGGISGQANWLLWTNGQDEARNRQFGTDQGEDGEELACIVELDSKLSVGCVPIRGQRTYPAIFEELVRR